MNISESVNNKIKRMKPGKLFSYQDFSGYSDHSAAIIKAISRHSKDLGLIKVKKGLYYKEAKGAFGSMAPKDSDVINYFSRNNNKTVGYITGLALYHRWGLTTQIPAEITIATSTNKREKITLSGLRITTIPAPDKVTDSSIPLLQFLDILRHIDQIPDASTEDVIIKLVKRLTTYSPQQIEMMENIAIRSYSAKTKALLGSLLETYLNHVSTKLYKTLNPTSSYKITATNTLKIKQKRWYLNISRNTPKGMKNATS